MIKILQFGEGNFLRAFAEDYINTANEKGIINSEVTICQPRKNTRIINLLNEQNCEYNVYKRGRLHGEVIDETVNIKCVKRCIDTVGQYELLKNEFNATDIVISNTTEAGIVFDENDKICNSPDVSFPAKITALMYGRYRINNKPILFLPVELIENNANELKKCILKYAQLWSLEDDFVRYVDSCSFCNTLVDRIVSGHNDADSDKCSVNCEPYASWIIEANDLCKQIFPLSSLEGIEFAKDVTLYRTRKVRILNGAHTMSVLAARLCGFSIVRDMMQDELFCAYITKGLDEVKSTLPLDKTELDSYAASVLDRFNNPFIDHRLLDIALNSVSKFKARCLDTILDYTKINCEAPNILCFGLAALIEFYLNSGVANDSSEVIDFFTSLKGQSNEVIVNNVIKYYNIDSQIIYNKVLEHYNRITDKGILAAVSEAVYE